MIYAYLRVSSDKQALENQKYEILKFADQKKLHIDHWTEETISATKKLDSRKLGDLLKLLKTDDILIVSEISRLGRSLMEVMSILHNCMENDIKVFTVKEAYELGDNVNSKVLAFAFGLSAEIERNMISQRTKEALARRKSEGVILGRPKGSYAKTTKLTGKEDEIRELLKKNIGIASISRILGVHRLTVDAYVKRKGLRSDL